MASRTAHEINMRVRDYERRQVLLRAATWSQHGIQGESRRSRQLRCWVGRALYALATRIEPNVPLWHTRGSERPAITQQSRAMRPARTASP